jgi:hypothetical protein
MSFYEDQEDDWLANNCKGAPSDYYAGELAPWLDNFTDTSTGPSQTPRTRNRSKKRREQRKKAKERKAAMERERVQ